MTQDPIASLEPAQEPVLSVSALNREARWLLESHFPGVVVEGELSNVARPSSGHWYFTLKDDKAQVRCAMFRNRNMLVRFRPTDGALVRVRAKLSVYEGRGDYQLIVERMEPVGDGALQQAFEALKRRLFQEGLFDPAHKRALPGFVRHVGLITSPSGAAVRDILSTFRRRFPAIRVTILPVTVQGQAAATEMIHALALANRRQGCLSELDAIIIGRGGGSLEDLWSFNDEGLARAIHASELPVVSAVGHEVDFTIADFVADLRAATPTAAAELLSPDQQELMAQYRGFEQQLRQQMQSQLVEAGKHLARLGRRLRHPGRRLQDQAQRLDRLEIRLQRAFRQQQQRQQARVMHLAALLKRHTPLQQIQQQGRELANWQHRLLQSMRHQIEAHQQQLAQYSHALHTVSPLATLSRGYAITTDAQGKVLRSADSLHEGMTLHTRLHRGRLESVVKAIHTGDDTT